MKKILLTIIVLLAVKLLPAQDTADSIVADTLPPPAWTKGGMGGLVFSEVGLWNWAAGGQSNITLIGNANVFANYKKGITTWDNSLDVAYGFIKNNFIYDPRTRLSKAEDRLDFTSKFGRESSADKLFYAILLNFRTQFAPGYATPLAARDEYISTFMAPAYIQFSVGMDYKPNDHLSFFLSPLASKTTIVLDDSLAEAGAFGVNQRDETGKFRPGSDDKWRIEVGANFRATYKGDIMKNVALETTLDLFTNYMDRPQNVDVRWTTAWKGTINKHLGVSLSTELIYDHDVKIALLNGRGEPRLNALGEPRIAPAVQFKQVFGLTVSYKFPEEKKEKK